MTTPLVVSVEARNPQTTTKQIRNGMGCGSFPDPDGTPFGVSANAVHDPPSGGRERPCIRGALPGTEPSPHLRKRSLPLEAAVGSTQGQAQIKRDVGDGGERPAREAKGETRTYAQRARLAKPGELPD